MTPNHKLSSSSTWVDQYGNYLYSFALYRIQSETIAQDLVQDTLTAALKSKSGFKGKSSEKTWLTGILKHKITDYLRKKYREPVLDDHRIDNQAFDDQFDSNGHWVTGPLEWKANPQELLEQKSFLDMVKKCLASLPKQPAHALTLREIEGDSTKKICKLLNITPTNCWVILHRARSLMRKCIENNWFEKRDTK